MKLFFTAFAALVLFTQSSFAQPKTDSEKATDLKAQQLFSLLNTKKLDSAYGLMAASFKKAISAEKWAIINGQIAAYLPLQNIEFVLSKNTVNKYKTLGSGIPFQLLVALDSTNLISTFALQPYKEEARKLVSAATDNPKKNLLDNAVDKLVSNYINSIGNVGISVAVFYKGNNYFYNYGETVKENKVLPTKETLYEIGSITKTFTALLLAKAVIDKKVKITDAITTYLPDSVAANKNLQQITLQQLSNHASGLPRLPLNIGFTVSNALQPYENYNTVHLFGFLKQFTAIRKPGELYEYSNLAVGLLGVILEKVYNKTFNQLVQEYIALPMGLTHTKQYLTATDNIAEVYNEKSIATPMWNFGCLAACGALKSNTTDLLQYGKQQLPSEKSKLFKYCNLTHIPTFKDSTQTVGLGWHFLTEEIDEIIQHGGGTFGCRSMLAINKTQNIVVVILANNATTADGLGLNLMKEITELRVKEYKLDSPNQEPK